MNIKEIRELEDKIKEVDVVDTEGKDGDWEGRGVESEGLNEDKEEEKKEDFSIGDTMLARGQASESWRAGGLEDALFGHDSGEPDLEGEEFEVGFGGEEFEEEEDEFGGEGFSYETMDQGSSGDLYGAGAGSSGGDLYGAGGSGSGMDLYGAPGQKGSDSASLYNTAGNVGGESSMYNVANTGGKKSAMSSVYQVEGGRQKKFREGGKRKRSELEGHVARAGRARKGVSMM